VFRRSLTACAGVGLVAFALLSSALPGGATSSHRAHHSPTSHGLVVHVTPSRGLVNAQTITVSGTGLPKSHDGSIHTWFVSLCVPKAAKVRNLDPDYSPYCSPTVVESLHVLPGGTFSAPFKVATGKIGSGHCGVPRHDTCLVAVGTGEGQHVVVTVKFKNFAEPKPKSKSSSTTTTKG